MPIIGSKGAESSGGFGQFAQSSAVNYIEDVFNIWLYGGNNTGQTITNNIDLSTKGGLVWLKPRSNSGNNTVVDTARGAGAYMYPNATTAQNINTSYTVTAFNTNGFTLGLNNNGENASGYTEVSWTFRKQPKFFDVVTYTGDGTSVRAINHNLGSTPGFIIVKASSTTGWWYVAALNASGTYYRSASYTGLNTTDALQGPYDLAGGGYITSTQFVPQTVCAGDATLGNASGVTYVAYLFASNAGGFGLSGADNVITCGSYTGNGSATGPVVTLGYEPQWLMIKKSSDTGNWQMLDNMRGIPVGSADATLQANLSNAESSVDYASPTATGFQITSTNTEVNTSSATYIYIAIRRGPMKVPTDAATVLGLNASPNGSQLLFNNSINDSLNVDLAIVAYRNGNSTNFQFADLLRGFYQSSYLGSVTSTSPTLSSSQTSAESTSGNLIYRRSDLDGYATSVWTAYAGVPTMAYGLKRAPGFLDVVCYTGNGGSTNIVNHNLTVAPELTIVKNRVSGAVDNAWGVRYLSSTITVFNGWISGLNLDTAASGTGLANGAGWSINSTSFDAYGGGYGYPNLSGQNYVAYLFATCAGVSKVGTYTGNGTTQTINCGFTGGARFVLLKRTDSTGAWYVYDTYRGMTTLTDPYLLLNSTAAETATLGSVTTVTTGFAVNASILAAINTNAATYIFLAIA